MARNRMIRPEFWEDTKVAKLSPYARLFFIALWNFADDEGFLDHDPVWLKAKCFPYDKVSIEDLIKELIEFERVAIQNGVILILNFSKHQRVDKAKESVLRSKFGDHSPTVRGTFVERSGTKEKLSKEKLSKHHLSEEEFISSLKTNPAYKHINIEHELGKMDGWILAHPGRQKTKRFVINWLNKIDKPMEPRQEGTKWNDL